MSEKKKQNIGIALMLCCSVALCLGQFIWKSYDGLLPLVVGFVIYGMGALIMLVAYRFGRLSVLQPVNSVTYVFAVFIGALFFDEGITAWRLVGVALIVAGIVLLAGGEEAKE